MKLLSVAIPCYNSEAYMSKCINSLLIGGEEVEIIIVDDGSSDRTAEIADDYAEKYPTIVKAIHQENGGHGQAVNTGIKNATGLYFKVVDSDDWVNQDAYYEVDYLNVEDPDVFSHRAWELEYQRKQEIRRNQPARTKKRSYDMEL